MFVFPFVIKGLGGKLFPRFLDSNMFFDEFGINVIAFQNKR